MTGRGFLAFLGGVLVEGRADDLCPEGVSVSGVQLFSVVELKMGRQRQHEEAVDSRYREFTLCIGAGAAECAKFLYRGGRGTHMLAHIDTQSQVAQQEQRLL